MLVGIGYDVCKLVCEFKACFHRVEKGRYHEHLTLVH